MELQLVLVLQSALESRLVPGVRSVLGGCVGLTGSYLLSTPVGASVVVVDLLIFLLCCGVRRVRG